MLSGVSPSGLPVSVESVPAGSSEGPTHILVNYVRFVFGIAPLFFARLGVAVPAHFEVGAKGFPSVTHVLHVVCFSGLPWLLFWWRPANMAKSNE